MTRPLYGGLRVGSTVKGLLSGLSLAQSRRGCRVLVALEGIASDGRLAAVAGMQNSSGCRAT